MKDPQPPRSWAPPAGVTLKSVYDQSALVRTSIHSVGRAIAIGAVPVIGVLLLLVGDLRAAFLVVLTLPLSVALAGLLLKRLDVAINTMTLGGLAIALGLLVDAAILVTENIVHHLTGRAL